MSELEFVGAFVWNQVGRQPTTEKAVTDLLSLELRWFKPAEAREVVSALVASGLYRSQAGQLTAHERLSEVEVPRGFRPSPAFLEEARRVRATPLLDRILALVAAPPNADGEALRTEVSQVASDLGVPVEAAALLVAWRRGVRDTSLIAEFEKSLSKTPAK